MNVVRISESDNVEFLTYERDWTTQADDAAIMSSYELAATIAKIVGGYAMSIESASELAAA